MARFAFRALKRGGFWDQAHPSMECVLPWQNDTPVSLATARESPQARVGGHILLWPALGNAAESPLFMRSPGESLMGVGILPAVPPQFLPEALPRMKMASQAATMMGASDISPAGSTLTTPRGKRNFWGQNRLRLLPQNENMTRTTFSARGSSSTCSGAHDAVWNLRLNPLQSRRTHIKANFRPGAVRAMRSLRRGHGFEK